MRWSPLARKECRTVLTSKGVWLLALLLIPWGYRPDYIGWDALGANITVAYIQVAANVVLPLGVLILSYNSIVAERTSGSLKFVLGMPLTRSDILTGKIVGRAAGIAGPVCLSFLAIAFFGLLDHGVFDPILFLAQVGVTVLYIVALVTVATSVSALVDRTVTAAGVVFGGVYLLVELGWKMLSLLVFQTVTGVSVNPYEPPASGPLFLLVRLSPSGTYRVVSNWLLGVGNSAEQYDAVLTKLQPAVNINALVVEPTFAPGQAPWYLHEALGLILLIGWIVVPFALARYRFTRGDLV